MGLFKNKGQSPEQQKAAVKKYKAAKKALDDNYDKELAAARAKGQKYIGEETSEYLRLNGAVNDALKDVPWIRR